MDSKPLDQLKAKDPLTRRLAAEALGTSRDRRAVRPLIAALRDPDWGVVRAAAVALGRLRDPRAIQPLLSTVARHDEEANNHISVGDLSRALYAIGARSLPRVSRALRHRHPRVRVLAAETLSRLGDPRMMGLLAVALKDSDSTVRTWAQTALRQFGPRAIAPIVAALRQPDAPRKGWPEDIGETARTLVSFGPNAVLPLMRALASSHRHVRAGAAWALGELKDRRAVASLLARLRDRDWVVRWRAIEALDRLEADAATPLLAALEDRHPRVREAAARALDRVKNPRVAPALIRALKDENLQVRWEAAGSLGELGDRRAVGPLCDLLRGDAACRGYWIAGGPANALAALGDRRAVPPLIAALRHLRPETRWGATLALGKLKDRRAVKPLIAVLASRHARAPKDVAIRALGELGDRRAIPALLKTDPPGRYGPEYIVEAVAKIQDRQAVPFLVDALRREATRSAAQKALRRLPIKQIAPHLVRHLDGPDAAMQREVAVLLVQIRHPKAVELLLSQLRQGSGWAATALGHVRTVRVVRALIEAFPTGVGKNEERDWDLANEIEQALMRIGSVAVKPLIEVLRGQDPDKRRMAAGVLGKLRDRRAVPTLMEVMRDSLSQPTVAEALMSFPDRRARRVLRKVAAAGEPYTVSAIHRFVITEGRRGSDAVLIRALNQLTTNTSIPWMHQEFAGALMHCGHPRLARVGRAWDRRFGKGAGLGGSPEDQLMAAIFGERIQHVRWGGGIHQLHGKGAR